ncbi:hypothetical protein [Halotalea alkalilenta]|uniref:hypothetical protein n=1 Tax=Halotalea alkalilenta TaxID=376489 RepID=UPI0012DDE206|nr:hypothetical protein [Halotalea alkalilenta]
MDKLLASIGHAGERSDRLKIKTNNNWRNSKDRLCWQQYKIANKLMSDTIVYLLFFESEVYSDDRLAWIKQPA